MRRTLYGSASSSSVMEAFHPFGVAAVNNSIMTNSSNLTLHDSSAARSGAAQGRDRRVVDHGAHRERAADADDERACHEPAEPQGDARRELELEQTRREEITYGRGADRRERAGEQPQRCELR